MACIICGSDNFRPVFKEHDITIYRCKECGHIFSSFAGQTDYDGYFPSDISSQNHAWWQEGHARMYADFRRRFLSSSRGRLLDIGCGLGYFLDSLRQDKKTVTWETAGVEISPVAVQFAHEQLNLKQVKKGQVQTADYEPQSFDWLTLWDVIEHIPDPRPLLKSSLELLKPGGFLFVATPNVNIQLPKAIIKQWLFLRDGHQMEAKDHLHNYSPASLRRLLLDSGFTEVRFIQLPPISAVSGYYSRFLAGLKELWYQLARGLFFLSAKRININNLYVIASKK